MTMNGRQVRIRNTMVMFMVYLSERINEKIMRT